MARLGRARPHRPIFTKAAPTILDGFIAHWKLNEASGDATDSHASNTLTDTASCGTTTGKIGNARTFNGTTQYFVTSSITTLNTLSWSTCGWAYLTAKASNRAITAMSNPGSSQYSYEIYFRNSTDNFSAYVEVAGVGSTVLQCTNFGSPSLNTWYFVQAYYNDSTKQLGIAVNNGTFNTTTLSGTPRTDPTRFFIGASTTGGELWPGNIDSVSKWGRVLTAAEWTTLYNSGTGVDYPFVVSSSTNRRRRLICAGAY